MNDDTAMAATEKDAPDEIGAAIAEFVESSRG
jgi:hypothetical protein